eukprot:TRINITY_DN2645_c1_g1_i2.p1 TRINITY_DN2645_c1_g1~~TRINITY_DN2645_c1_g1_i2.p1  ORF type:complete len:465 (-),score=99.90 TRINITY_DN2645_c1_g1_i2:52-1446(-)
MERWNLDKRLVYNFLRLVGIGKKKILATVMFLTAFLSMWMSSASSLLVMIPITRLLAQNVQPNVSGTGKLVARVERAYLLGILYASAAGGIVTPIGCSTNLITISNLRRLYPLSPEINFGMWMAYGLPICFCFCIFCWLLLSWRYFFLCRKSSAIMVDDDELVDDIFTFKTTEGPPFNINPQDSVREIFQEKISKLGKIKPAEIIILICWLLVLFLWIFRSDITFAGDCIPWKGCVPGWHRIFTDRLHLNNLERKTPYIGDAVPILFVVIPLFLIPACDGKGSRILNWEAVRTLPWSVLLLIGGGFALANAFSTSGLSRWLASGLYNTLGGGSSVYGVVMVLVIVVVILAVVATSPAIASVIVPVFADFALRDQVHPFMYVIPTTVAVSFALILPTSTPVNAIIFTTQKVNIKTKGKYGEGATLLGILFVYLGWLAIGQFSFKANQLPSLFDWNQNPSPLAQAL